MVYMRKPRGLGNYVITTTRTDGTTDAWCETSKDQAIATARTYSALEGYAAAEVRRKTDGTLVGRYEGNVLIATPDLGTHADLPDPVHHGDVFSRIEASQEG